MSSFVLQIIAMVTMFIDHTGGILMDNITPLRAIGRIAFPLYAFMLAEGFTHYKDDDKRLKNHFCAIGFLALLSEIAYDFAERANYSSLFDSQSVLITVFFAFIGLYALTHISNKVQGYGIALLFAFAAQCSKADYGLAGVLLIYAFYFYCSYCKEKPYILRFVILLSIFCAYLLLNTWDAAHFGNIATALTERRWINIASHLPALLIISFYNNKVGYSSQRYKVFYRYFYPVHLFLMGIVAQFTIK